MDLRNGNITVGELLRNPAAVRIFNEEFPGVLQSPMVRMARGMSLNRVLGHVRGRVPQQKLDRLLTRLREL
ncbi:MAG TPA: hypothetical protein IAB67_00670 [Candidatus Ventrousia excrementavium]|uniref:Uncharacterized protein n=1 Tax=Candidatus Ventrousia excrementavium TaxID=2840961 RepID=A0A9D1ITF0_9CLOT|nr:hypothetical protein [Candidatus Ventrousia excrementavium]